MHPLNVFLKEINIQCMYIKLHTCLYFDLKVAILLFILRYAVFILLQFYSIDKTDTPLKHFLLPDMIPRTCFAVKSLPLHFGQHHVVPVFPTHVPVKPSVLISLQPYQFGITRTPRKSADIPSRVSIDWLRDIRCTA